MENKPSMSRVERLHREKVTRYSIRKYSFGAASVAVAALFMFLGNGAVSADMTAVQPQDESGLKAERPDENAELPQVEKEIAQPAESTPAAQPIAEEPTAKPAEPATPALDKTKLESYIKEIEAKLANGSYANKTDESVAVLKADLEAAKTTLANATSQDELTKAYNKLVTTANTKLKNKPVEKKETPAVDTTNGKETVGKQAENTEKKSDSNSIENTGSNDPRNGKAMDKENALRTETTKSVGNISYTLEFSDDAKKEIYLYNEEDANVNITVNSTDGAIRNAFIKAAGNVYLDPDKKAKKLPSGNETKEEVDGFGWTYHQILSDTPSPATVSVTGKPNDTFKRLAAYTKKEDQHAVLGDRYLQVQDAAGGSITAGGNSGSAGYFKLVVKSQTYKYNIQEPAENGNKIGVTDIDNLTATDIQKIKDQIKIEYSKTSTDARLESKKGQLVDNQNSIVKRIDVDTTSKKVVVTYTDDSTDETPLSNIARTNEKPTVEIEYSDSAADKKEVYVYASEVNTFDIKIKDDSGKIASAELKRGSNQDFKDVAGETNKQDTQYGFTANKFTSETTATAENPAVITYTGTPAPEGTFTETKLKEVTRGENPPGIALGWRFVKAIDKDGADARGNGRDATDPTAVNVVLKPQTLKYDIKEVAQADKLPVADASNVTEAEFNEIKKRVEIQYSKTNPDKRLESKRGEVLTNRDERVDTIERNGNNLVVTYKDGSTDTKPLTDFARTNPAPTVSIPYSVDGKKDVYVYANEDIDIDIKFNDDSGKVKSATLLQGGSRTLPPVDASNPNVINNEFNTTFTKIDSETATPASIKITGKLTKETPGLDASKFPTDEKGEYPISTRYATATDTDDASIVNVANGSSYNTDPGGFRVVLKAQAKKYDIVTPTEEEKVAVANPEAVTDEEFAKIKAKLEYSRTNEDKNLESKRGEAVDNTDNKIATITKDGNNIVATYTDGSKDTRPLSDFTKLDKQPAIDAVNTAATEKIAAIKATPNATDEEKQAAIDKVTADQTKALAAINDANVTTKTALDAAQKAGTDAIAADNPVVAKKDAAKADVEAARKAKEDAIKANPNLSEDEKTAAIAKVNKAAEDAKKAIDAATSNADVETAKNTGISEFGKVNPVAKAAAKKAIADELSAKNTEIDGRQDLSQAEKDAAKAEAKKLADAQLDEIAKQPDNAETADAATAAQTAVNNAGTKGVADVKAVNPLGKTAAKADIETARQNKVDEITNNSNLSQEEKDAAIAKVNKAAEDAAKAIDAAQTADELTTAKGTGTTAIDNVTPVAKTAAKKAIADALTAKNAELDKRTDLTDEEKTAAKAEAQKLADAQLAEIAKQPDAADTKEAAQTAQDAVNAAGTKGAADVAAVNPVAKAKESAKADVEAARKAKEDAIKKDPNLSDKEKDAAIAKVNKAAEDAKKAIDAATSNADVETAKGTATTELGKVNPIAKENAKAAIANALTAKNAELDKRTDLTTEEKDAAKAEAKKLADAELAKIDAQPDNADTPEAAATAQKIVDDAEDKGVADVTAVNPEAKSKPAAKKAIEDKLAKQLEDIANTPDATDDEKKVAADAAKALADEAKEEIDKAGTDAEVKQLQKEAEGEIEKSVPVVEDKPNARKAIDDEATAKKAAIDARDDLTPKAKEDLKAQVDKIAEQAKKSVDKATTAEAVNGIEESDKAAIKAVGEVNIPADKVLVNDPSALTDAEKAKVLEAVKKVNPEAKEITQDADGNITVTTLDGHQEIITPEQVVKTADTANDPKAGNDVVKPADKVVVNDPAKLTDAEKEKIKAAVEAVNPNSIVVVDDKGNAKVSTPDGQTQVIPVEDLVRTVEDTKKPNAGNDIVKPADKTVVANPDALTPEEKKAIEDKVKAVNPGSTVVVDDKGNATVTTPEGKTAVIPASDLTKSEADAAKPNAGNDIVKPADKTVVANPDKLTDAEKKAIEDKVKAVNPGSTVVVDDKGNATVTTPEGKTAVIPASDLTKSAADAAKPNAGNDIVKPADKTVVANPDALTPEEKKAIEDKVKAVNPGSTVVVDDKGNATVTTPEGKTAVIPASDLTKSEADAAKPNAGNDIVKPADKTVVANPDKLTDAEKKAIEDKVKAVNPGSTVVVDDKGNATVTTPAGKTAVIPASDLTKSEADAAKPNAGNDVNTPSAKTVVANPDKLTDAEKKAIEDKVKAVNPGATVVVDDKGNATVTTPEGKTAVIPATDLVKTQDDITKENAGNDVNTPAAKTVVANPDKLTDAEKKAIEDKVKAVNPGSTVVVDDKGNATVAKGDGTVLNIPALDLVIPADDLVDAAKNTAVKTPAIRTLVADKEKLTDAEKAAVKKAIEAVNPGATVVVDDKGNATVTLDGNTVSIAKDQLVKTASDVTDKNSGDNINLDFEKETVADLNNLTDAEKEAAKAKIKGANADVVEVIFDKAGNATVVTKDGKVLAIAAEDIFKQRPSAPNSGGNGTSGNNGTTNTDVKVDKAKLEGAIRQLDELIIKESAKLDAETVKEANDLLADAKKVFANADASQAEVDAMVKRIEDFMAKVAPSTDHATPANDQAAQTPAVAPATTQAAANASQTASAQANARKAAKELPNTGTADSTVAMVAAAASAVLGLGLAGRRRKEDEEA